MKRTQVYLPDRLHERVRRVSFQQRKSMAQVVREAVTAYVQGSAGTASATWDEDGRPLDAVLDTPQAEPTPEEISSLERNPLFQIIGVACDSKDDDSPPQDDQ